MVFWRGQPPEMMTTANGSMFGWTQFLLAEAAKLPDFGDGWEPVSHDIIDFTDEQLTYSVLLKREYDLPPLD